MVSNEASSPRYTRRSPTRPFTRKTKLRASTPNRATWTTSATPSGARPRKRDPGLMSSNAINFVTQFEARSCPRNGCPITTCTVTSAPGPGFVWNAYPISCKAPPAQSQKSRLPTFCQSRFFRTYAHAPRSCTPARGVNFPQGRPIGKENPKEGPRSNT
jgi:hypothetical protein